MKCISRELIFSTLNNIALTDPDEDIRYHAEKALGIISKLPVEDCEPVVKCINCKYFSIRGEIVETSDEEEYTTKIGLCELFKMLGSEMDVLFDEDNFCSKGVLK